MGFKILKVKSLMSEKKITQSQLSEMIDVSRNTVVNYFNGRSSIDVYTLEKIIKVLGVDISYFFDDKISSTIELKNSSKKKYLEERVDDIEFILNKIEDQIKRFDSKD